MKSCAFFGHRNIEQVEEMAERVTKEVEKLIVTGEYDTFYFGGFGEFDEICYNVVTKLKEKYPFIKRIFCLSDPRHQRENKRPQWLRHKNYEEFVYFDLKNSWWYTRIYYRNIEIIDRSDYIIFYVTEQKNSGSRKAMNYARKTNKEFRNLV